MSVGSVLGAPPTLGQTGWGRLAQALGAGYDWLTQYSQQQRADWEQMWERAVQMEEMRRRQEETKAEREYKAKMGSSAEKTAEARTTEASAAMRRAENEAKELQTRSEQFQSQLALEKSKLEAEMKKHSENLQLEKARLDELRRSNAAKEEIERQRNKIAALQAEADVTRAKASLLNATLGEETIDSEKGFTDLFKSIYASKSRNVLDPSQEKIFEEAMREAIAFRDKLRAMRQPQQEQLPYIERDEKGNFIIPKGAKPGDRFIDRKTGRVVRVTGQ